jgi:environmental stress-induced protein Ves
VSFLVVRTDDAPAQPWRNGGGTTRELHTWPDARDWRVRISVADIEADGPFSSFPGVRRWFTVLKGAGVELSIDGTVHRLRRGDAPLAFDGGAATSCRLLAGPTRDLNLMLRAAGGAMQIAADGVAWRPDTASQCGLYTAVAGRCLADGTDVELPPYALLWFEHAPAELTFTAGQRPAAAVGWWLAAAAEGAAP